MGKKQIRKLPYATDLLFFVDFNNYMKFVSMEGTAIAIIAIIAASCGEFVDEI